MEEEEEGWSNIRQIAAELMSDIPNTQSVLDIGDDLTSDMVPNTQEALDIGADLMSQM